MPSVPTAQDVRKAGEQARAALTTAFEQARTPLLAAVGAGDIATQAVLDALTKARTEVTERAESARTAIDELPTEVTGLRERLDRAELRKALDQYTEAVLKLYQDLSAHGEKTFEKLRTQPQLKRAVEQFDQAAQAAQQRAETAVEDARELADDVLGRVVRRTRSTGEKAAVATERIADDVAGDVTDAGAEAAHELRSTSRKAASRTTGVRKTTTAPRTRSTEK